MSAVSQDRFRGCLLGLALGDALGGRFEAQSASHLRERFASVEKLLAHADDELWYTDDTQMMIGVAETLCEHQQVDPAALCQAFVTNYVPSRGYGRGARAVLEAMEDGDDYQAVAEQHFPGGSYGNGAAMRVAPVGLCFHHDHATLWEQARLSALPTHVHPLGIEGAQLLALAVSYAVSARQIDRTALFDCLLARCQTPEFRAQLQAAAAVGSPADLAALGNGIEALHSVPTAIASFALTPESFSATIGNVILLGGDTDTLAAMAGALSGAFLGAAALPVALLDLLENHEKGRGYIVDLADRLWQTHPCR